MEANGSPAGDDRRPSLGDCAAVRDSRAPIAVDSLGQELVVPVVDESTDWTAACRAAELKPVSFSMNAARPGVASLSIPKLKLKTFEFRFSQTPIAVAPSQKETQAAPATIPLTADPTASAEPQKLTRIKPPGDVVKLSDRLFYMLQPALEHIVSCEALDFPFQPFPYQLEGIAFLYPRIAGVLADEMGLGKTMQAITAIRLLLHAGEVRKVLLICPKPLVTNWQREFAQWAAEIPLVVIEGDQAKRRWQWQLDDAPVKVANYELLHRDRDLITEPGMGFDLVVLDEAQRIKNKNSNTSQVVKSIERRRAWALTGTPVENSSEDLVGIFDFVAPGYLHSGMQPRRLGKAAGEYVLRRTKDRVLTDLPPKMIRDAEIDLTPEQRHTYDLAENEGIVRLNQMESTITIQHVFELVLRLKQICNFDPATGESAKFERLQADMEEVAASGRKAIVFSQWVSTLQTLSDKLQEFGTLEYHGQIPSKQRDNVIRQFKEDKSKHVLLISYGAGGVGLNLQFSEYVFLFDRWWNPAIEDQAINRAHRIGAAGPVTVTRFVAQATIEQRIDQILRDKREIFDTIFSDVDPARQLGMTQEEIFGLFNLRCPSGPIRLAA